MRRIHVLNIIGTRPEVIKMAPLIHRFQRAPEQFSSTVCITGQHREMVDSMLDLFGIVPDIDLNVMTEGQSLSLLTARLFEKMDNVIYDQKPNWIVAQGDTTSVFVAAMTAYYRGIRFAHVEAGLRTGDLRSPFPEEVNRCIADLTADLCCAPTERARENLIREGCDPARIEVTGNTVVDALLEINSRPYEWQNSPLSGIPRDRRLILVTAHRRENFGEGLSQICTAIRQVALDTANENIHIVYPVHLNPQVCAPVKRILSGVPNLSLLDPVDYLSLINLMKHSVLILTDSGGIQEEAVTLGVPVLVMREKTERQEGVEAGGALVVGTTSRSIATTAVDLLRNQHKLAGLTAQGNPYGDGIAAQRIAAALIQRNQP